MLTSMSDLTPVPPLRHPLGLKIGLVSERSDALADEFSEAARALGAEVTLLAASRLFGGGPSMGKAADHVADHVADSAAEFRDLARVLSRLYDVVVCDGLPAAMTHRWAEVATVPVHDLSELLPPDDADGGKLTSDADRRRWRTQAAVLAALR